MGDEKQDEEEEEEGVKTKKETIIVHFRIIIKQKTSNLKVFIKKQYPIYKKSQCKSNVTAAP